MVCTEATGRNRADQTFQELIPASFLPFSLAFVSPLSSCKHWPLLSMSTSGLLALGRGNKTAYRKEGGLNTIIFTTRGFLSVVSLCGFTVTGIHSVEMEPQPAVNKSVSCWRIDAQRT